MKNNAEAALTLLTEKYASVEPILVKIGKKKHFIAMVERAKKFLNENGKATPYKVAYNVVQFLQKVEDEHLSGAEDKKTLETEYTTSMISCEMEENVRKRKLYEEEDSLPMPKKPPKVSLTDDTDQDENAVGSKSCTSENAQMSTDSCGLKSANNCESGTQDSSNSVPNSDSCQNDVPKIDKSCDSVSRSYRTTEINSHQSVTIETDCKSSSTCADVKGHDVEPRGDVEPSGGDLVDGDIVVEDVSDDSNRVSDRGASGDGDATNEDDNEEEEEDLSHLEHHVQKAICDCRKYLKKIEDRVKKLENQDMSLDDLDSENSTYLLIEKFKHKGYLIYKKIQQLKRASLSTQRQQYKSIKFTKSAHSELNEMITKLINRSIDPPDFPDVLQTVKSYKESIKDSNGSSRSYDGTKLDSLDVHSTAVSIFKHIVRLFRKRRCYDFVDVFQNEHTKKALEEKDPAENDPELLEKLSKNKSLSKSECEVLDQFANANEFVLHVSTDVKGGSAQSMVSTLMDEIDEMFSTSVAINVDKFFSDGLIVVHFDNEQNLKQVLEDHQKEPLVLRGDVLKLERVEKNQEDVETIDDSGDFIDSESDACENQLIPDEFFVDGESDVDEKPIDPKPSISSSSFSHDTTLVGNATGATKDVDNSKDSFAQNPSTNLVSASLEVSKESNVDELLSDSTLISNNDKKVLNLSCDREMSSKTSSAPTDRNEKRSSVQMKKKVDVICLDSDDED